MRLIYAFALLLLILPLPAAAQDSWILLQEYDAPGNYAHGLYYGGKYLYHVDWDTSTNVASIYVLNPYNMHVIDIYPSPVEQPWGIGADDNNFWLTTHGNWGNPVSQLVKIQQDTFAVEETYNFPGYYFYAVTYDSVNRHLWVACQTQDWIHYWLEFDSYTGQVVAWHPQPYSGCFTTGMQYWRERIWSTSSDFNEPDYTFIVDVDSFYVTDALTLPYSNSDDLATNGFVWWLTYWRFGHHIICKVIPPGSTVHDIAAYMPIAPTSGMLSEFVFSPCMQFINYGSIGESEVPFVCRIKDDSTGVLVYIDSLVYEHEIPPERIVEITYDTIAPGILQPDRDYTFTFYSAMEWDQVHCNDTMRVHVHTENLLHDLAILSVSEPDSCENLEPITATILVQNQGDFFESIAPLNLQITRFQAPVAEFDVQVFNLAPLDTATVMFPVFIPDEEGMYYFTFNGLLPVDANPLNDYVVVNCQIGTIHDVAVVQILDPGAITPLGAITPRILVENRGDFTESSFPIVCTVSDSSSQLYNQGVISGQLGVGEQAEIVFPDFIPQVPSEYTFTFAVLLPGDEIPANDTLAITSSVGWYHDIAPIEIISPQLNEPLTPITPRVVVANLGAFTEGPFYTSCTVTDSSTTLYFQIVSCMQLQPTAQMELTFPNFTPSVAGDYTFTFTTLLGSDAIPGNDTLRITSQIGTSSGLEAENSPGEFSDFRIDGCYPNPYNLSTTLIFQLPAQCYADVTVYRLDGTQVWSRSLGLLNPDLHQVRLETGGLPSGIYWVRLRAG
ncbi:MAG: T9SS type A sorting domain-containing protein, partial [bacterium]